MSMCNEMEGRLNDYIDGTLPEAEAQSVEAHLGSCPACRRAQGELRALIDAAEALPKAVMPKRDLWPAVAGRIQGEARSAALRRPFTQTIRRRVLPFAAAVALIVAALYGGAVWRTPGYVKAEADYMRTRAQLLAAIEESGERLSPGTLQTVEANLRVIDDAVQEIRAAIEDDPNNPRLVRMLMATRQKELDLLVETVRTPQQIAPTP